MNMLITVKLTKFRETTYNGSSVLAIMYTFHKMYSISIKVAHFYKNINFQAPTLNFTTVASI